MGAPLVSVRRPSDEQFRLAAEFREPHQMVVVPQWAAVERAASGGAYVELRVWVTDADAARMPGGPRG